MTDGPTGHDSPTLTSGFSATGATRPGSAPALRPGTRLGTRYEIEAVLGQGGMGTVYRARDLDLGRTVALKVIRPEMASLPEVLERFKREILLASQVTHRNVLRIHDLGEAGDLRFISMQYVTGTDLKTILRRDGPLPLDRVLEVVRQIAPALQAAHDAGVVHRDLKPQNILVDTDGQAYIADFGISRSVDSGGTMTETGMIIGTVDYMAPEQARGVTPDHRADIYALGVILYEMFTGRLPFTGDNALSVMMRRVHETAPSLRRTRPEVPAWVDAVVARALEREPAARYPSAAALLEDFERRRASRSWRRYRKAALWTGGAVVATTTIAAAAWIGFLAPRAAPGEIAPPPVQASLAILPFRNGTGDTRLDWVREGLPNLLRTDLQQWPTLRLAGEDRVGGALRGLGADGGAPLPSDLPARLAGLVGVDATLHGSLVRAGNRFRLDAALQRSGGSGTGQAFVVEGDGEEAILGMVDDLSSRVRDALGIRRGLFERDRAAAAFSSKTVEAIRLYQEGRTLALSGGHLEASRRFEAALKEDPDWPVVHASLAESYDRLGQDARAAEEAERAVAGIGRAGAPWEAARIRGVRARVTGDLEAAEAAYAEIARLLPNDAAALLDLAGVQQERNRLEEAERTATRAAAIDPKNPNISLVLGRLRYFQGRTNEALADFTTALNLNTAQGNDEGRATTHNALGNTSRALGRNEEALSHYREALAIRERLNDTHGISLARNNIALVLQDQGRTEEAMAQIRQAVDLDRKLGSRSDLAESLGNLGRFLQDSGRGEEALAVYQESLGILREMGDDPNLAATLANLGATHSMMGHYLEGYYFLKEALERRRANGFQEEVLGSLVDIGIVEQVQGRYEEALRYDLEGLALARETRNRRAEAVLECNLSNIHEDQGRYAAALAAAAEAETVAREVDNQSLIGCALIAGASARGRVGDHEKSDLLLADALGLAREHDAPPVETEALIVQGLLLIGRGDRQRAAAVLAEAERAAGRLQDRRLLLMARLYRAVALQDTGRIASLIRDIQSARLEPLAGRAHLALARIHAAAGRSAPARQEARAAIELAGRLGQKDLLLQAYDIDAAAAARLGDRAAVTEACSVVARLLEEVGQGLDDSLADALKRRPLAGCRPGG